ncbi:hypothetical protein [Flavobacterium sp.]|uniref:DUF6943 family protein n=1 Tax=Flavobacterium sp. TaxID=239 RepID=UPI0025BCAE2E|nr:hypothetical protein [Flavobacterium sp.]MBA4153660.1 hypothetical protein [Flavobacterium sp.]
MINFKLKHHKSGMSYSKPHFFILNKGLNTGKPLSEPCPNCFVIQFGSTEDSENMESICKSLWRVKFWHQFLIGSVIPYIRINDFSKNLTQKSNEMMLDFELHKKNIAALKLLEQKEKQFHDNINLINDMRRVILYRYCKR